MTYYPPTPTAPPPHRRQRSSAGLWAVLTFGMLLLCSATLLLVLATGGQLPKIGSGPSWTPPAPTSSNVSSAAPPDAPPSAALPFAPNDVVENASGGRVNLRQSPGFQNKPASDIILVVQAGDSGTVLEGPIEADGLSWWRVRFGDRAGWMAERSNSGKVLLSLAQ